MKKNIRALIVDDEELARIGLKMLIQKFPSVELVGEAWNLESAAESVEKNKPDVIFLDIEFPGESGFDLLDKIDTSIRIVFVTAFDEFAIRAFEVNACDYLLKPVNPNRLAETIKRLNGETDSSKELPSVLNHDDQVFISIYNKYHFIKINSIIKISAAGKYSELLTSQKTKGLINKSMQDWEDLLPSSEFIRIHRSTIINLNYIEQLKRGSNYSYSIKLKDIADPIPISRRNASQVKKRITI